jgi:hypothetical protein
MEISNEYLEGTIQQTVTLNPGDRVQVWPNDNKKEGRQPDFKFKIFRAGKKKGTDKSERVTGLWRRLLGRKN